jgi:hypothetical protein
LVLSELESLCCTKDVELKEPVVQVHDDVRHAAIAPVQVIRRVEPCDLRLTHLCVFTTSLGFFCSPVVTDLDDLLALFLGKGFVPVRPRMNGVEVKGPSGVGCLLLGSRVHRYNFSSIFQENVTVCEVLEVAVTT